MPSQHAKQVCDEAEEALEEVRREAKKMLKGKEVVFRDIGTKDIFQVRQLLRGHRLLERTLTPRRALRQLEVPKDAKVPSNWTKMSGTQKLSRYYTPETTRLIADLKEARERKQMVINDFQYKVCPLSPSSVENSVLKLIPSQLYGEFDKHYSTWMAVIKAVAQLDCLLSLSKSSAALGEPCVRPEIVEAETAFADFEDLRHPCIFR